MKDSELAELLTRYLAGQCTEKEKWIIEQWYADLDNLSVIPPEKDEAYLAQTIWTGIQKKKSQQSVFRVDPKSKVFGYWFKYVVAACACLVCSILLWHGLRDVRKDLSRAGENTGTQMIQQRNDGELPKQIDLEDGSRIVLYRGGRINYPSPFHHQVRDIYLEGDAFFDIQRDEQKPFYVYTADILTSVLGTSFSITSCKQDRRDVEIDVISGKVKVQYKDVKNEESAITLTQNQKVVCNHQNKNFELGIISTPQLIASKSMQAEVDSFIFRGTSLLDVLKRIEKGYGIHIELENMSLMDCPVTADLTEEEMYTKLDIISASVGANYIRDGSQILFTGGQCE
jgi:transmembrane sensor